MKASAAHLTQATIHLDRLDHNLRVLSECAGGTPLWPVIKANAYGHGAELLARHLHGRGYDTLCVADISEARQLQLAGIRARLVLLSPSLPAHSEAIVTNDCEAAVSTPEMIDALASAARQQRRQVTVHVMVDTGMGRDGIQPGDVGKFLARCAQHPEIILRGLMSHFASADSQDKRPAQSALARFEAVQVAAQAYAIPLRHMANSAAIFELPGARFDAVRPGISLYGLRPSPDMTHPRLRDLRPVLEWTSRITLLKEVAAGTGLSYGHDFHTTRPSLIATVAVGYGDGLSRGLSGRMDMLVQGQRCPQVGRITMDQCLLDVTTLRGRVALGDEVVLIGRRNREVISADELAATLGTINYEIVTAISQRVPRVTG